MEVDPPQVWLTGARSRVLRVGEAMTETIDVSGLDASTERQVKLSLGDRVWMEDAKPVIVRIEIEPTGPAAEGLGGKTPKETG